MDGERLQAKWNIDQARLQSLHLYLSYCEVSFLKWDLEGIWKHLLQIRRIIAGKIHAQELKQLTKMIEDLQNIKQGMAVDKTKATEYYNKADEIYIQMNILCKEHGLYFREYEDDGGL